MARYRKFVVALLGALVQIAQAGLLPVPAAWQPYVTAGIAVATALGVRWVPNAPKTKRPATPADAAVRRTP
jgi:low affinity Fe/Cu permease